MGVKLGRDDGIVVGVNVGSELGDMVSKGCIMRSLFAAALANAVTFIDLDSLCNIFVKFPLATVCVIDCEILANKF